MLCVTNKFFISIEVTCWLVGLTLLGIFVGKVVLDELERQQDVYAFQDRVALVAASKDQSTSAKRPLAASAGKPTTSNSESQSGVELITDSLESRLLTADINEPDQTLWSQSRKLAFANLPNNSSNDVLGILSIPSVDLRVPIYDGADDLNLDRGVARIEGTFLSAPVMRLDREWDSRGGAIIQFRYRYGF